MAIGKKTDQTLIDAVAAAERNVEAWEANTDSAIMTLICVHSLTWRLRLTRTIPNNRDT